MKQSRRTFIATACAALAGCVDPDGGDRATTSASPNTTASAAGQSGDGFEGLDPLGFRAVPGGVDDPPQFDRMRTYETARDQGFVDLLDRPDGLTALSYVRTGSGYDPPRLRDIGSGGAVTDTSTLSALPSNEAYTLAHIGMETIVGGHRDAEDRRASWLRSLRDGESGLDIDTTLGTVYAEVTADEDALLAAGTLWHDSASRSTGAICRRIAADGTVAWADTIDPAGTDARFWTVAPTPSGVLAGGSRANDSWLVAYDEGGEESWRQTVRHDGEAYQVVGITAGSTGTYAVATTNQFAQGNNHAAVLSLDSAGTVEWIRVFDPNYDDYAEGPLDLSVRGVAHDGGPVLVGHTSERAWLAALEPDGAVRWAGYYPPDADGTRYRPLGLTPVDGGFVLYGSQGVPNEAGEDPWLAWL